MIYSKDRSETKIYQFNNIEELVGKIREDRFVAEFKSDSPIVDIDFGKDTKYILVRYRQKLEIYHLSCLIHNNRGYKPDVYEPPSDMNEFICDFNFRSMTKDGRDMYQCFIACKILGFKKIKVIDVK